ncbi:hypothetical protein J31TS6_15700 [Brevibacillus reuszeri]|nr:hypothetical protein [Brevibacillus reuszeri]GIO05542.1 hypothetical protein J31TS6_15700 [Brevibacillus reuszeri]
MNGETISFDQMPGSENSVGYYYRFSVGIVSAITPSHWTAGTVGECEESP